MIKTVRVKILENGLEEEGEEVVVEIYLEWVESGRSRLIAYGSYWTDRGTRTTSRQDDRGMGTTKEHMFGHGARHDFLTEEELSSSLSLFVLLRRFKTQTMNLSI